MCSNFAASNVAGTEPLDVCVCDDDAVPSCGATRVAAGELGLGNLSAACQDTTCAGTMGT